MHFLLLYNYFWKFQGKFKILRSFIFPSTRGLVVHGVQGFDYKKARENLEIPEDFAVMAMITIGKRGPKENLPPNLQEKENPNDRKPWK